MFGGTSVHNLADLAADPSLQAFQFINFILVQLLYLQVLDHQGTFVLIDALSGEDLGIDNHAFNTRRNPQ